MKILLIRRDNIGDLILTTPLIKTLASQKNFTVDILANSYNKDVLQLNPYINKIYLYSKVHHREKEQSVIDVFWSRLKTLISIRKEHYDVVIIAKELYEKRSLHWAKMAKARRVIAIGKDSSPYITDLIEPLSDNKTHIVELLNRLTSPLGINEEPGGLEIFIDPNSKNELKEKYNINNELPCYGIQISARKISQRWSTENFIKLANKISEHHSCQILLFWSPGTANNPMHPGDDEKAQEIIDNCKNIPLIPIRTNNIRELMASMQLCDQIVTSDGGALHIAAGVGVPTVALFGDSDAFFWGPWGVANETLQAKTRDVSEFDVNTVYHAFTLLRKKCQATALR